MSVTTPVTTGPPWAQGIPLLLTPVEGLGSSEPDPDPDPDHNPNLKGNGDGVGELDSASVAAPEIAATEEVLRKLEEADMAMQVSGAKDVMVVSLDISTLYLSLDQEQSAEIVSRMIQESQARIDGVNLRCTQVYLASSLMQEQITREGLQGLLQARVDRRGRKPGPTTRELGRKHLDPAKQPPQQQEQLQATETAGE